MRSLGVAMGDCFVFLLTALEKGKLGSGWMTEKLYIWMVQLRRSDKQKLSSSTETWLPLKSPLSFTTTKDIWQLEKLVNFSCQTYGSNALGWHSRILIMVPWCYSLICKGGDPGCEACLPLQGGVFSGFFGFQNPKRLNSCHCSPLWRVRMFPIRYSSYLVFQGFWEKTLL